MTENIIYNIIFTGTQCQEKEGIMKETTNNKKSTVKPNIHNVDAEIWEKVKEIARQHTGTYYGLMGNIVSEALELWIDSISKSKNPSSTLCRRKNIPDPKQIDKTKVYIKICKKLLELPEGMDFTSSAIKGENIASAYEEQYGRVPSRQTISETLQYFIQRQAIRRDPRDKYRVIHLKLKEILENLGGEV